MKHGWKENRVEDCLEKVVYTNKIKRKDFLNQGDFPIISQEQDFINGYWNDSSDLFIIKKPVIIFGDHTRVLKYVDFNFVLGADGVKILQPRESFHPKFFYYFLQSKEFKNLGYARHYRLLRDFLVPLPPLPEQRRIVAILDEAFAAIAKAKENTEKNLQNARELFQSFLQSVFANPGDEWELKQLVEVCEKITDGTHVTPHYLPKGIPFLSVKNLTKGFIDFSDTKYISKEEHQFLTKSYRPEKNDLLYTKVGTTGIAKVVDTNIEFSIFVSIALLKLKHDLIFNKYLEYFLNSPYAREQAKKRTRGTANKNLVISDIKEIKIHFPKSLNNQQSIVTKLDTLSTGTQKLEATYRQKLADLEELRQLFLRKAFEGEL